MKEALEQALLCSKGKSTASCRTEKWNPAGEPVFGAKRNQQLCRNGSKLLENGKGVWCWAAEGVSVVFCPNWRSLWTRVNVNQVATYSCTALSSSLSPRLHSSGLSCCTFCLPVNTEHGSSISCVGSWKVQSGMPRETLANCTFLYSFCALLWGTQCSRWLCDVYGYISIVSSTLFIQMLN